VKRRLASSVILASLALLAFSAPALAAFADTGVAYTFEAVDGIEVGKNGTATLMEIEGLQADQAQASSIIFRFASEASLASCQKLALMVVAKPGRFSLRVTTASFGNTSCKLLRR